MALPTLSSASVDATGLILTLNFATVTTPPMVGHAGFTVIAGGVTIPVASGTDGSTSVTLTLGSVIRAGQVVTVAYAPGNVTDSTPTTPNALAAFSATAVTDGSNLGNRNRLLFRPW